MSLSWLGLLLVAVFVVQASSYVMRLEEDISDDSCSTYCTCNYGLSSRSTRYCCPTGVPDPDQCATAGVHTSACSGRYCGRTTYVTQPRIINRCRECSPRTLNVRRELCSTQIGSLIGCNRVNYGGGCISDGSCNDEVITSGCQFSGGCSNSIQCCQQTPIGLPNLPYQPIVRPDLRLAVVNAAQRNYATRSLFIHQITLILRNQAHYSWAGEALYDEEEDEIDFDITAPIHRRVLLKTEPVTEVSEPTVEPETTTSSGFSWD